MKEVWHLLHAEDLYNYLDYLRMSRMLQKWGGGGGVQIIFSNKGKLQIVQNIALEKEMSWCEIILKYFLKTATKCIK